MKFTNIKYRPCKHVNTIKWENWILNATLGRRRMYSSLILLQKHDTGIDDLAELRFVPIYQYISILCMCVYFA